MPTSCPRMPLTPLLDPIVSALLNCESLLRVLISLRFVQCCIQRKIGHQGTMRVTRDYDTPPTVEGFARVRTQRCIATVRHDAVLYETYHPAPNEATSGTSTCSVSRVTNEQVVNNSS